MSLTLTFTWVIGDAVHITRTGTLGSIISLGVDVSNNKIYQVQFTDPVTLVVTQAQFLESELS